MARTKRDVPQFVDETWQISCTQTLWAPSGGTYEMTISNSFNPSCDDTSPGDVVVRMKSFGMIDDQNDDVQFVVGYDDLDPFVELLRRTIARAREKGVVPASAVNLKSA